jgi:uncharacterized membrane protein
MWTLSEYKRLFAAVGLIGVIACCIPGIVALVRLPGGEKFSELYILGPGHMAEDYPFNVRASVDYRVYLGVGNHMGESAQYTVYLKLRNASESLPNVTSSMPSTLPVLLEYRVFLSNGETWENALNFSFSDIVVDGNVSWVGKLRLGDTVLDVNKTAVWDNEHNGFYYQVFMELWIFNAASREFDFHDRFVDLWLNVTAS